MRAATDAAGLPSRAPDGLAVDDLMRWAAETLWSNLRGISWVGFYVKPDGRDEMLLAACRPKPACSPIGLHGMCGLGWKERRPIVVRDVAVLGQGYIACDPRDRSEVVCPLLRGDGSCAGVLDADSYDAGAFDFEDAIVLGDWLVRVGLSSALDHARGVIVI